MKEPAQQELFTYYSERAPEYEEFYRGIFATPIQHPQYYQDDTREISLRLPAALSGHCLDIACGTGFWLPFYHENCPHITLIDQSGPALEEARQKVERVGIGEKVSLIRDNVFSYHYPEHSFDCVNVGFFISHFTDEELVPLFKILRHTLAHGGTFTIIDSTWTPFISGMGRKQQGMTTRKLFDGREFQIYKRYFQQQELHTIAEANRFTFNIEYCGNVFFLATCRFLARNKHEYC